jgi:four helix bundle protein
MNAHETASLHRLDAYRHALDFRRTVVQWLPLKRAELSDQLDRASISAVLNIVEGAGRITPRERARHYTIARGSTLESLACLDLLELERTAPATETARPAWTPNWLRLKPVATKPVPSIRP